MDEIVRNAHLRAALGPFPRRRPASPWGSSSSRSARPWRGCCAHAARPTSRPRDDPGRTRPRPHSVEHPLDHGAPHAHRSAGCTPPPRGGGHDAGRRSRGALPAGRELAPPRHRRPSSRAARAGDELEASQSPAGSLFLKVSACRVLVFVLGEAVAVEASGSFECFGLPWGRRRSPWSGRRRDRLGGAGRRRRRSAPSTTGVSVHAALTVVRATACDHVAARTGPVPSRRAGSPGADRPGSPRTWSSAASCR